MAFGTLAMVALPPAGGTEIDSGLVAVNGQVLLGAGVMVYVTVLVGLVKFTVSPGLP